MRKLTSNPDIASIYLNPGDSIQLSYTDETGRTELLTHKVDEEIEIDYVAVAELEAQELDQLGLKSGLAGIFGKKS